MDEDTEYLKLPVEDRCVHKLWKARVSGYEAAAKNFQQLSDEKSPEWSKYLGLVKKFVIDSNAVAQEKGLDAVLAYVENAGCAGKTVGEVTSGIIGKCLGAPKARTKEKGIAIIMMYFEIERQEIVQDELMKGLSNKTPKVVVACIQALREALRDFGPKVVTLKPIIKQIPVLLEDRDKGVRDEAKLLTVEVYRWIGAALKPQLSSLKPVQLTELEAEFDKLGNGKAVPTRYLRSQQVHMRAKMEHAATAAENGEEEEEDEEEESVEVDPYDLMTPVNILSQLSSEFLEKCEAKKWQERKEAMDTLQQLSSASRLEPGDYGDVVRALKKIIGKDSNVIVIVTAGKCLANLANGLKSKFHPYAGQCIPTILEKFKERKQNVVQALREAIDAIYPSTNLDAIQEDVLAAMDNKNPAVKTETVAFVVRCLTKSTPITLNKKLLKVYCPALIKTLNDTDPVVRDNSAEALGTAMKVVGEKIITPFIQEVDALKMTKVKECCEKAVIVAPKVAGQKPPKSAPAGQRKSSPLGGEGEEAGDKVVPVRRPVAKPGSAPAGKKLVGIRGGQAKSGGAAKAKKTATTAVPAGNSVSPREFTEKELSEEEVEEQAEAVLPSDVYNGLADVNWKTRLVAMEQFVEFMRGLDKTEVPTQMLIRVLAKKPGFRDTNFQVLKYKIDSVIYLATECSFSRRSAQFCVAEFADKLGDAKNSAVAAEALSAIAEATKLDYVSSQVLETAFSQKNPKTQSEAMCWLSTSIKEFGLQIQVKSVVEYVKKALSATNPAVRSAAINLTGVMYLYVGPSLRMFFENEKAALLQQMDAEFEKLQGIAPPAPTRGLSPEAKLADDGGDEESGGGGDGTPPINIADLIPRTDICNPEDISGQITTGLLQEMADKNWKVRGEALQKLATIISEAKFITPNLGDLSPTLKARLTDSNKNLAVQALNICQAIGTAMGPNCTKYVRVLAPGIVVSLGDNKNMVRAAALTCLNAWLEECGLGPFVEGDMLADALKTENPSLRSELLGWLLTTLPQVKVVSPDLAFCVPHLYTCLEDRNSDVRKKAQDVVLPFMIHLGYDKMALATGKLKPVSKTLIMGILDKTKPNLPAKPAPKPRSQTSSGKASLQRNVASASGVRTSQEELETYPSNKPGSAPPASKNGTKRALSKTRAPAVKGGGAGKKKEEDMDTSPPLQLNNVKDQRVTDEHRLKVLKWNFTAPRDEFYELLKDQMTAAGFNRGLQANLFHNDFKFHIKGLDSLIECLETYPEASIANLDLVLKWLALRFFDTNPSVLLRGLEYLQQLFQKLAIAEYHLLEYEAASFIPYLVMKVGDPKDSVRQSVRTIFHQICKVYPASKMFTFVIEGLKSKNARQRTECLEELGNLIEGYGINVCQPNPTAALKEVTRQISDRDNSVRNAALNCVVQAYFLEGEKVYKYVGPISDKEMCLLEERIKRSSRNRPLPSTSKAPVPEVSRGVRTNARPPPQPLQAVDCQKREAEEQEVKMRRNSTPSSRPVSGMFTLDLDKIEQLMDEQPRSEMPNLVQHDLDDILMETVRLPETRMRPPSPATKLLSHSTDVSSTLDLVISQVASNNITTSVNALAQIDEFLKDENRADMVQSRVDQVILAESLQFRMVYTRHMGDDATNWQDISKLYRCLIMTLVAVFSHSNLAKRASKDVLRDLVYNLITILLDERLNDQDEGAQVIRSINVLIVKIVERANCTNILSALIKLLHDCVGNDSCSSKFTELVMKCLWKMLRMLPNIIDELNADRILLELHLFLKAYPSPHWKDRANDTPLRTIKTVLHTLVQNKGNKIMSHLTLIDNLQDSELETYLQKVLKGGVVKHRSTIPGTAETLSAGAERSPGKRDNKSPRRLNKSSHEMLAEIFKKIGSKDYTKEGLADLYDFKKRYPDANIEPFLRKSSQFFQNYIERGLRNIEQERDVVRVDIQPSSVVQSNSNETVQSSSGGSVISSTTFTNVSQTSISSSQDEFCPSAYMERLKSLRARCGYDNTAYEINPATLGRRAATPPEPLAASESKSSIEIMSHGMPRSESSDAVSGLSKPSMNVDDLRQRLERIKNSTKS